MSVNIQGLEVEEETLATVIPELADQISTLQREKQQEQQQLEAKVAELEAKEREVAADEAQLAQVKTELAGAQGELAQVQQVVEKLEPVVKEASSLVPAPAGGTLAITAVSPTSGPEAGGTTVTLSGEGFVDGATVEVGGVAATDVQVLSATSLTFVTPAVAASGGPTGIVVTTPAGSASSQYTYEAGAPAPSSGPTKAVYIFTADAGTPDQEWSESGFETVPPEGSTEAPQILYYFAGDHAAGETNGATIPGWTLYTGATQAVTGP